MRPHTLLLVNDDPQLTNKIVFDLANGGYRKVIPCASASAALALTSEKRPALVIADMNLRDLDGFQLARLLTSSTHGRPDPIPVLLFSTTYWDSRATELARQSGAVGLLRVPYREGELTDFVDAQLRLRTALLDRVSMERSVLCVTADEQIARRIRHDLSTSGHAIQIAPDASAAIEILNKNRRDLVVVDYDLPQSGTTEILRWIRNHRPGWPVVVVASAGGGGSTGEFLRAGAAEYVTRSFTREELAEACGRALTKEEIKRGSAALESSEQRLQASEHRYREQSALLKNLIESSADGILLCNRDLEVTLFNPAAARIFQMTEEKGLGESLPDLLGWEAAKPLLEFQTHHESRHAINLEVSLKRNGVEAFLSVVASRLTQDPGGELLIVVRDMTKHKELEEQLRQAQKMEAVGQLAGGVAHDFNNLLTAIIGYTDMALEELEVGSPLRDDLAEVKKSGERAVALTRQLLAFSRRQVLQPEVLDLNAVVINVSKMLRRVIGENIELVTVPCPTLGRVEADPSQIEQVILNLAVNARDAMPDGGRLTIETTNLEVDETYRRLGVEVSRGSYVLLVVSDSGCGMNKETQTRIFEPFFTTKEIGKGTGLGLSTVFGIVKQSGGYVWVYSEPGMGTTFKVYLPRIDADLPQAAADAALAPRRADAKRTILLVEDEDSVRSLARRILEKSGYRVLEAHNGTESLKVCTQHAGPIDMLITDVIMPELSGPQTVERLSEIRPEMKILYMSGYTDMSALKPAPETTVPLLRKPFTAQALNEAVQELLGAPSNQKT